MTTVNKKFYSLIIDFLLEYKSTTDELGVTHQNTEKCKKRYLSNIKV